MRTMELWGVSDVGAVRKQNQDAYYVSPADARYPFAVVCDGMGGARAGNVTSSMAVESFAATVGEGLNGEKPDVESLLRRAVEQANELVCYRAAMDESCRGMGTTLVAAVVGPERVYLVNVGDSRAYMVSHQGIRQLTRDHSVVEDLVERGEITHEEARLHPQKNLITRALGAEAQVAVDSYVTQRQEGTLILLCSDGLSNVVTDQELLFELIHGGPASEGCERLLHLALSRGAPDNVTAVLIQL